MNLAHHTLLITGGSSGIGRALAEALHRMGNRVVIAGRRQDALEAVTAANPGMRAMRLDVASAQDIRAFATRVAREIPDLDFLVNNAGIQRPENLLQPSDDFAAIDETVAINLLGPMRLTSVLLPLLLRRPRATILNVSSTLAFLPMTATPAYCATKAGLHSWTQSLRHQLEDTPIEVLELIPPYVQTALGPHHASDPMAMPLDEFVAEVLQLLRTEPTPRELVVGLARPDRFVIEDGTFDVQFAALNGGGG
jgi:uncharacterized oxidoreductase